MKFLGIVGITFNQLHKYSSFRCSSCSIFAENPQKLFGNFDCKLTIRFHALLIFGCIVTIRHSCTTFDAIIANFSLLRKFRPLETVVDMIHLAFLPEGTGKTGSRDAYHHGFFQRHCHPCTLQSCHRPSEAVCSSR